MKKLLILLLIGVFALDTDAQDLFEYSPSNVTQAGFSAGDEFSTMLKKRKKRRKSKRGKRRGKGSSTGLMAGAGLYLGLPMGDFGKATNMGLGLNADVDYLISPELSFGVHSGFHSFKYKTDFADEGSYRMVPFLLKGNFYFMDEAIKPYVGLGLGMYFNQSKFEYSFPNYFLNPVTNQMDTVVLTTKVVDKSTDFGIAPHAGVLFGLSDNLSLNVNAKYEMFWSKNEILDKTETQSAVSFNFGLVFLIGQ